MNQEAQERKKSMRIAGIVGLGILFFSTGLLVSQVTAQEKILPSFTKKTTTPASVQLKSTIPNNSGIATTSIGSALTEAIHSEWYPVNFARKIRSIAQNKALETQELTQWATKILIHLDSVVIYLDRNQLADAWSHLEQLKRLTVELSEIRNRRNSAAEILQTEHLSENESLSDVALEEIQLGLERRGILWGAVIKAETIPSFPVSQHFGKEETDIIRLYELTIAVENFFNSNSVTHDSKVGQLWCNYLDTDSFLSQLEACQKTINQPNRRVSILVSLIPMETLVEFCDRANVILSRLNDPNLTETQRQYLNTPVVAAWKNELAMWTADTVSPRTLLKSIEQFEATAGMSDMENLFRLITRLSFSRTSSLKKLGILAQDIYGGANVKIYISKVLVNKLLPPPEPEIASFRDVIMDQSVYGRRRTDTNIEMNFIPVANRLLLSLDVSGTVRTTSRADAGVSMLLTGGRADYEAQKQIELTENGFVLSPCHVRIQRNRLELLNFQTNFDGVPLLSGLVRNTVRNQYEIRQQEARSETQQKIARQVRDRINKETENRFKKFNTQYQETVAELKNRFELFLEQKDTRTEADWLLASWAIRGQDSLCSNTPAPETQSGSFADIKIHESALNMFVGKLNFGGKALTVGEIRQEVAERFNRPQFAEPSENDDVPITFAAYNPITLRFVDGRIEISISIESLKIQWQTYKNFTVLVRYRPQVQEDGDLVLKRDPVINLVNAPRGQIPLRAAFAAIFPPNRPFSLKPQFLKDDPRFADLTTGHCRIEKGWFAVALIANDSDKSESSPDKKLFVSEK